MYKFNNMVFIYNTKIKKKVICMNRNEYYICSYSITKSKVSV